MSSSVTVNLVLTLRKFLSLVLSIYLFDNHYTSGNALGALLVLVGTIQYTNS